MYSTQIYADRPVQQTVAPRSAPDRYSALSGAAFGVSLGNGTVGLTSLEFRSKRSIDLIGEDVAFHYLKSISGDAKDLLRPKNPRCGEEHGVNGCELRTWDGRKSVCGCATLSYAQNELARETFSAKAVDAIVSAIASQGQGPFSIEVVTSNPGEMFQDSVVRAKLFQALRNRGLVNGSIHFVLVDPLFEVVLRNFHGTAVQMESGCVSPAAVETLLINQNLQGNPRSHAIAVGSIERDTALMVPPGISISSSYFAKPEAYHKYCSDASRKHVLIAADIGLGDEYRALLRQRTWDHTVVLYKDDRGAALQVDGGQLVRFVKKPSAPAGAFCQTPFRLKPQPQQPRYCRLWG